MGLQICVCLSSSCQFVWSSDRLAWRLITSRDDIVLSLLLVVQKNSNPVYAMTISTQLVTTSLRSIHPCQPPRSIPCEDYNIISAQLLLHLELRKILALSTD